MGQAVPDRKADRNCTESGYLHYSGCCLRAQQLPPQQASPVHRLAYSAGDLLRTIFILISVTLTGLFFYQAGLSEANIITLYILGVLLASITTTGWSCSLLASACSVIVFNYFFTTPRFTFHVYGKDYPVTFIVSLL